MYYLPFLLPNHSFRLNNDALDLGLDDFFLSPTPPLQKPVCLKGFKPLTYDVVTRAVGTGGEAYAPPVLADQLTLSQPGEQILPTTLLHAPPHCVLNGVLRGHFLGIKM